MSPPQRPEDFYPVVSGPDWGGRSTRAEISLDAIEANVRALAGHVAGREVMAVVKADAYGHGAAPVARAALRSGASWLAVYTVDEGLALRHAGIQAPVLVFGPVERAEAAAVAAHQLTATVTSLRGAELLADGSRGRTIHVHLKVDTGLTRAGAHPDDIVPLAERLRLMPGIEIEGLYTHLARADEPGADTTPRQLAALRVALQQLRDAGHEFRFIHASNSAGALWWQDGWCDMVRTGIAMYGYSPNPTIPPPVPLRPALSLLSRVTRVTAIGQGTGVGYGHAFRAVRPSRIALVPIGYGDGLHRALGNGVGAVLIRERRAPIVGRVSMDQITVDVTDVAGIENGDTVTIIGRQGTEAQTADDIARQIDTISYEVLTGLLPRVPRIYSSTGHVVGIRRLGEPEPVAADREGIARE